VLVDIGEGPSFSGVYVCIDSFVQDIQDFLFRKTFWGESVIDESNFFLLDCLHSVFSGFLLEVFLFFVVDEADSVSHP
jgi:hypothetical protein